ncbi:MAG TPA: two-component regulator propeller domain-containing protein, partial [Bacteroidia bacterium]|nr:two-component regulator propeller domain-containing protein [Bacteroidia bacterium]
NMYFISTSTFEHLRRSERRGVDKNTLKSNKIQSVLETKDGTLWIGTANDGLMSLDRKKQLYTDHPKASTANNGGILSICEAKNGLLWVGTWGGGLNQYNRTTGEVKKYTDKQLRNGTVLCIAEELSTGAVWFGTFGAGLYRLDPATDSLRQYTVENDSLSSNYIYTVYFDRNGNLWIGTRAGGAMFRDKASGEYISFTNDQDDKQSLSNNIVYCITEDQHGNIWISTANGLNRFDSKTRKFEIWYESNGLPSDNIYAVVPDTDGYLWLSHNKGLTRFKAKTGNETEIRNFGQAAGVQPAEFNQGAYGKNSKGELFFGGQEGLNIIDTRKLESVSAAPPVYLTSYKRFGKEVGLDSNIVLKKNINVTWRDNNFMFELAALDFVDPARNVYQYKLEGIDDDWSPVTTNRFVSYTNLPGGNFRLLVRAADSNGNWSPETDLIHIFVEPPFWKTNWFYILCSFIAISGVIIFIRHRTAAIKKENRILEAKVAERTQELAEKNADITASIEYAKRIQSAILPDHDVLYQHFRESFVLYKPKDIVSGDFYWFAEKNDKAIVVVADCTGHGVPGALMSMIGHNLLNQIVLEKGITEPDEILNRLNNGVRSALKQDHSDQDTTDGMDIAVCVHDRNKNEMLFAGALRPLILIRKGLMSKVDSDRFPIGGSQDSQHKKFTLHRFMVDPGDSIYLFSDGFADQFGGEKGKKFMLKRLLDQLISIQPLPMKEQLAVLDRTFESWREGFEQVDDVLLVGIKIR